MNHGLDHTPDPLNEAIRNAGTLALVGSGEYLPPSEPLDRFLISCLKDTPRVVCLPTAAGAEGDERIDYWGRLGENHFRKLGAQADALTVIDRPSAMDESLAARIAQANFVYFSGGKPDYLYRVMVGTPCWTAVVGVLAKGGVVAGCSAGAMIFGERIPAFRNFQTTQPGFGGLPHSLILPHYDEIPAGARAMAHAVLPGGMVMVGVEGSTALVICRGTMRVAGLGGVTLWGKKVKQRLTEDDAPFDGLDAYLE